MDYFKKLGLAAAFTLGAAVVSKAATLPLGVQNDVTAATVAGWGFTECYAATYSVTLGTSISDELAACSVNNDDYIMLAARRTGASVFEVLAATTIGFLSGLDTGTGDTSTTVANNGAEWYNADNYSVGFAGLGDSVFKFECDTTGRTERDRLCWHTLDSTGGYRAGSFTDLNVSTDWEKVMLVSSTTPIPVPGAAILLLTGLGGIAALRHRKKA